MLVLTLQPGRQVIICDDIIVTILEVRGNDVRLGFDAPPSVPIVRDNAVQKEPK